MKLIHLSDLHIGKRVNGYSLIDDQRYILQQILEIIAAEVPDAVLLAGDIYDKAVPSAEAVCLFDEFLTALAAQGRVVFIISGNHDSAERLAFGGRIFESRNIFVAPLFAGTVTPITMSDEFGEIDFWLLPFVKPAHVRPYFPEEDFRDYDRALQLVLANLPVDTERRNVMLAHQFITGAATCESEELSIGGLDQVSAAHFAAFDYVALGHLHGPQQISRPEMRYCGTPLKYSFSEAGQAKSVTIVDLGVKGEVAIKTVPLKPLHDLRKIKGFFADLIEATADFGDVNDYLQITLTDEDDIPNAVARLKMVYPRLMRLEYDNKRTRSGYQEINGVEEQVTPFDSFAEFFRLQNGQDMNELQTELVRQAAEKIWGDE